MEGESRVSRIKRDTIHGISPERVESGVDRMGRPDSGFGAFHIKNVAGINGDVLSFVSLDKKEKIKY